MIECLPSLGLERGREPVIGEDGWVDAAREIANVLQRIGHVGLQLGEEGAGLLGIAGRELLGQPQLDRQGDQLLLRAVVEVALELAGPLVLRGDDPSS